MQGPIVLLAVFTIADIIISQVLAEDFIKRALENLQRHQNQDLKISGNLDKYQEHREDDDDDDDDSNFRAFKDDDLALLELALKANDQHDVKKWDRKETSTKKKRNQPSHLDLLSGLGANDVLVYDPDSHRPIRTERQKHTLLDIFGSPKHENAALDVGKDNLPIYVIVKANDGQRGKSDDSINNLLSSLLNQNDRSSGKQDQRYKGFRIRDSYRRARDSNEKYSSVEMEDKRPLSRPRTYGGGGGGRTPIPYIRHRGDIYEKDT